ncbi:MAG: hypothetical protein ACNS62_11670, partial [Candidatus Cyclobacteriaceae bacterium M3_2C_046]
MEETIRLYVCNAPKEIVPGILINSKLKIFQTLKYSRTMKLQINEIDYTGQNIYVGFDVHLKSWTVAIMTDRMKLRPFSQDP